MSSEKSWFKRREYITDTVGSRLIAKVRAGNYGVGNTYQGIKNCQLCGAHNMNHESHIILMCRGLSEVRATTDVGDFLGELQETEAVSTHFLLKQYMDADPATLTTRAEFVQYILQMWEKKVNESLDNPAKTYCYCNSEESGRMVQCDGSVSYTHLTLPTKA